MAPKKILFCEDFSKNSEIARKWALEYARAFDAALVFVHVVGTWPPRAPKAKNEEDYNGCPSSREPVNVDLEELAAQFRRDLVKVTACTKVGSPADEILRVAEEEGVDLIVMGTHGWTGIRYKLLGSVAEDVLRRSKMSVLVVRSTH